MSDVAGASAPRAANPWLIAVVVTIAAFMEVLDTTIVNVALPHIAGSMSASVDESTWTLTSYLISNGIVLTISGALTRLLGRKRYFLICIAMFTVFSFLCGISTSLGQIIVMRLLQGLFGGGLQPNQQSIILDTFAPAKRAQAFAVTALATVVAPVLGPVLGGWITDNYSWRWIFLINIPVGIVAFFRVMALVKDPPHVRESRSSGPFDYVGLGLIVLGLGAFQIVLDRGETDDWFSSPFIWSCALIAAMGIGGAIAWLLYTRHPIVNLRTLKDRNFGVGCVMIAAMSVVMYSSSVLLPQLSETQLGYTATWAGLVLMPGAAALIALIVVVGRLMPFVQTRLIILFGFLFLGAAFLFSRNLTPDIDFRTLTEMRVFQTIGLGFLFVPISAIAYLTLPPSMNGDAAALFTMFRNVMGSVGISLSTALVTTHAQIRMAYLSAHQTPYSQPWLDTLAATTRMLEVRGAPHIAAQQSAFGQLYQELIAQAQLLSYADVFMICAVLAFCVAPLAMLLSPVKAGGSVAKGVH